MSRRRTIRIRVMGRVPGCHQATGQQEYQVPFKIRRPHLSLATTPST
jgi:hypothetical protein